MRYLVCVLVLLSACKENAVTPRVEGATPKMDADQIIFNMEQYITEAGIRRAVLRGDTAFVYEDSMKAHIRNVRLTIFDTKGAESAHLTSREGDFSNNSQAMVARGNVVLTVRGEPERIVETEELHYDPNTHRIWSDVATTMREAGSIWHGTGFDADDKFVNVKILNARSEGGGLRLQF